MNYTVVWLPNAVDELAALWTASARQAEVTVAAAELDQRLAVDPNAEGESRPNGRRITFVPPLAIIFRVYENSKAVVVTQVWEFR